MKLRTALRVARGRNVRRYSGAQLDAAERILGRKAARLFRSRTGVVTAPPDKPRRPGQYMIAAGNLDPRGIVLASALGELVRGRLGTQHPTGDLRADLDTLCDALNMGRPS